MTFSEDFNWNIYIINSLSEADSGRALSSVEKTEFHLMNSNQEYVFIGWGCQLADASKQSASYTLQG